MTPFRSRRQPLARGPSRRQHQVVDSIVVDVAHGNGRRAVIPGEGRDRGDQPIAIAVVNPHFSRVSRRSGNRHGIGRDGRDDIDQGHQPVVFVVEAMAVHHEQPGEIVELHAEAERAGLDDGFLRSHDRRRHVGIVDSPHFRPGLKTPGRIEIVCHLEVVDVDVDRMLVIVVVEKRPFLHRAKPWLEQGSIGKSDAFEHVHEGFGI
jgi:hypothetical protein